MELDQIALKHAAKNAADYGGSPDKEAVVGKVFSETDQEPSKVIPKVEDAIETVSEMSEEEIKNTIEDYSYETDDKQSDPLPNLQDTEDGVVLRFAPNPNGPPHLGSARGMVVNGELKQKYDGELVLRFDDTDPRKKRPMKEAYRMYEEDYAWLGYDVDRTIKSSHSFDHYIKVAEQLIEKQKAYVCKCSQEKGREYRRAGEKCPHREKSVSQNMSDWEDMKNGSLSEGEATLKVKTKIDHKNPAIRDFVAFRIIESPDHPILGDKYRVFPLLDFAGAVEDQRIGTTHIVRGKDLRASTKRQKYIYDYLGWEYPNVRYWGNVQVGGFEVPMSTSTLKQMISDGELNGWDDVRAPTIRSLKKRGFQPEAIREFFTKMGVTENDVEADLETLKSENRSVVESSDRAFFLSDPVKIEIESLPESKKDGEIPFHPDHQERGMRNIPVCREKGSSYVHINREDVENGKKRLKGLCNVELKNGSAEYLGDDHKKANKEEFDTIHWLGPLEHEAKILMPSGKQLKGFIEREIPEGQTIQLERFGFVRSGKDGEFYFTHD